MASTVELVAGVVVTAIVVILLTGTKFSPLGFIIRRMTRPRAILLNWDEGTISFSRINRTPETIEVGEKSFPRKDVHFLSKEKWFGLRHARYALFLSDNVCPVVLNENSITTSPISPEKLFSAIREEKSTRFMRHGMDWKIIVIIVLVIAVLGAVFAR